MQLSKVTLPELLKLLDQTVELVQVASALSSEASPKNQKKKKTKIRRRHIIIIIIIMIVRARQVSQFNWVRIVASLKILSNNHNL